MNTMIYILGECDINTRDLSGLGTNRDDIAFLMKEIRTIDKSIHEVMTPAASASKGAKAIRFCMANDSESSQL